MNELEALRKRVEELEVDHLEKRLESMTKEAVDQGVFKFGRPETIKTEVVTVYVKAFQERIQKLEEALKPFARLGATYEGAHPDDVWCRETSWAQGVTVEIFTSDFQRAAALLKEDEHAERA